MLTDKPLTERRYPRHLPLRPIGPVSTSIFEAPIVHDADLQVADPLRWKQIPSDQQARDEPERCPKNIATP